MTVIVYRDGVMAADTAVWCDQVIVGYVRKVWRLPDGSLFGASGRMCDVVALRWWLSEGGIPDRRPPSAERGTFSALLVAPGGGIKRIEWDMRPYDLEPGYHTCGAHIEFLHGALAAGASAEEAVHLAIQYGDSAAGKVVVERL